MDNKSNQHTISTSVSLQGKGLHTGVFTHMTLKPATIDFGIQFQRIDLKGQAIIPASFEYVHDCNRGTNLIKDKAEVSSVEHLLAALSGLGIDNILIELDNKEIPAFDGSAFAFTEAILKAVIQEQSAPRNYFTIEETIEYSKSTQDINIRVIPHPKFAVEVTIDYPSKLISNQKANLENFTNFTDEIAKCRTFVFLRELEKLYSKNLIQGGDLKNAIVFIDREISQEDLDKLAKLFDKPKVEVKPEGILNNLELYFENEPARHKLLDLIGDLSLLGMPIQGKIIAHKPGHFSNIEFVKLLKHKLKR